MRGQYSFSGQSGNGYSPGTSVSFPVPLASPPSDHIVGVGGPPTVACPGTASQPEAAPGNVCIYETRVDNGHGPAPGFLTAVEEGRFGIEFFVVLGNEINYQSTPKGRRGTIGRSDDAPSRPFGPNNLLQTNFRCSSFPDCAFSRSADGFTRLGEAERPIVVDN